MGYRNVAVVYACWSPRLREQHRAFRVLVYMALVAKDEDQPPRFFGGRDMLVHALGRSPSTDAQRGAAYEAVRSAVDELVAAGAIVRVGRARPGRNSEYHLRTLPQGDPVAATQGDPVAVVQGEPGEWPRVSLRTVQGEPVAQEEQEEQQRGQEEDPPTSATSGVGASAARQHLRDAVGWWR